MELMAMVILLLLLSLQVSSSTIPTLRKGSFLSVENPEDVIVSPNGVFSAGFHAVGFNAFSLAVWFTGRNPTVVWMANRDQPVNGQDSTLSLLNTGNLLLTDADQFNIWATNTSSSSSSTQLLLYDNGNLVLQETQGVILWQSFDFPTNTLLPQQYLTRFSKLVSSRSGSNHSSGFYQLFFDNDNVVRLLYDGPEISSIYWPDPGLVSWEVGRSTYNASRVAVLDRLGNFNSSDDFSFATSDYGTVLQRRLTLDYDGNIRVYSRKNGDEDWYISWQAISKPCTIHGICGANSICSYTPEFGKKCSCLPGYRLKNHSDWSQGCEPKFSCSKSGIFNFLQLPHVDFYGYDHGFYPNYTFEQCLNLCLQSCDYVGFQYKFSVDDGYFECYPKTMLLNGYRSPDFDGAIYLRLPKNDSFSYDATAIDEYLTFQCSNRTIKIERVYVKGHQIVKVKAMFWFACVIGAMEIIGATLVWGLLFRSQRKHDAYTEGYFPIGTGFRKFSYSELKKATHGFSQEIGRGGGGIVYKGELSDNRVAAVKRLNLASSQGEEEFLDEVSVIGRLNHMNLIKMWGYCAEGKHRLLVYEYMENGTLAENLRSKALDSNTRFNIAMGMARGLAYLHEECLEWILHCDIKPQNILLDYDYQPKVIDFGLSKLLNRNDIDNSKFSTIRGTRGYMAPEWIHNLPITSKIDVYSYGIVLLEMVTGKSQIDDGIGEEGTQHRRLVAWVREEKSKWSPKLNASSWVKQLVDPVIGIDFEVDKMESLVLVALECVQEDRDARPTMRQVVEMLQNHEND